jgi:ubiquinone/menaquinone biosynthesis C-methylase UbiE
MADRFARTADRVAAKQDANAEALAEHVRDFVLPAGDERALDAGTGAGALALALAPIVREVVGIDPVPELLALGRERAATFGNVELVEGDATDLPFADGAFDLTATLRTLHHVPHPERVVAELTRVTRRGGRVLVADQLGPADPAEAAAVGRFERARDPSHTRLLAEAELHELFQANGLALLRERFDDERRALGPYLDLAGCEGPQREVALRLAPHGPSSYAARLGWYLLERR